MCMRMWYQSAPARALRRSPRFFPQNLKPNRRHPAAGGRARATRERFVRNLNDGTKYSRVRPVSFLTHHMRQISSAAVITDAANIEKELTGLKISHAVGAA